MTEEQLPAPRPAAAGRIEYVRYPSRNDQQPGWVALVWPAGRELNKGESRNSLARAVFIHRLGEIRDRTYENQQHRASGLNLLVTAIILWNTRYLERAVTALREAEEVPDKLLVHLSPLGWEHINLTGDYVWGIPAGVSENTDGLRPLRELKAAYASAA